MSTTWQKVHLFISSTFNDMHAERDYLVKRVFPDLRDWCEERKLRLVDIDLRWGVTEADASNRNAVKICLEHINKCRPFFVCFLGQRHGYAPGQEGISSETFNEFPDLRSELHPAASITELEIRHAIFRPLAWQDPKDRRRVLHYNLAEHAFFYFREPGYLEELKESLFAKMKGERDEARDANNPQELKGAARQSCCTYTDEIGPEDERDDEREQRKLSIEALQDLRRDIVEHEITQSLAHRPVTYKAGWRSDLRAPELALPLECAFQDETGRRNWRKAWNRWAHLGLDSADLLIPESKQAAAQRHNETLTRGRLSKFHTMEETRDQFPPGAELARIIQHDLREAIFTRYPDRREIPETTELQREIDQHEEFISNSVEGFIERGDDFVELDDYVESDSNKLFVLWAAGGMGKSTLLANWVDRYRVRIKELADHSIHFRFIGQSDESGTVYALLRSVLGEIKEVALKLDEEIPLEPRELRQKLPELLAAVGRRGPAVIIIDALDQLESGLADLNWIPQQLPGNIKLIVSFKREGEAAEHLFRRFESNARVHLSEVKPFENEEDRESLVRVYLLQYLKELDKPHLETLIRLRGASNPLYLKVVLSELRVFGAFASLREKIRGDFGDSPVSAFAGVLNRLESDPAYSPIDPKEAVPLLFGLLAHARRGVSVDELTSLFIQTLPDLEDNQEWREAVTDTIYLLLRQVRPFMARREGRYDFFYESFKIAAQRCYVAEGIEQMPQRRTVHGWHKLLADYFESLPTWRLTSDAPDELSREPVQRKVSELPYHQTEAELWERLEKTLCDLDFIHAKCAAALVYDLEADYETALNAWPEYNRYNPFDQSTLEPVPDWMPECVEAVLNGLPDPHPDKGAGPVLAQLRALPDEQKTLLFEEPIDSSRESIPDECFGPDNGAISALAVMRWTEGVSADGVDPYDESDTPAGRVEAFATFVSTHSHLLTSVPEQTISLARNYAADGVVVERAEPLAEALNEPWVARDARSPSPPTRPARMRLLVGHSYFIQNVALSANGRIALSGSGDETLRVWDVVSGKYLRTLGGHAHGVNSVAMTPDGKTAVSASNQTLYVWDVASGTCLHAFNEHAADISGVSLTSDGKMIVSSSSGYTFVWQGVEARSTPSADHDLRVWDATTGSCVRRIETSAVGHSGVRMTPDGKLAVSWDKTAIYIWDVAFGRCVRTIGGQPSEITRAVMTANGRLVFVATDDGNIQVWDILTGPVSTGRPSPKSNPITGLCCSPGGRVVVSHDRDGALRVLDVASGRCVRRFHGMDHKDIGLDMTPDGRKVVAPGGQNALWVWDIASGIKPKKSDTHNRAVAHLLLLPDGKHVATPSRDHAFQQYRYTLHFWNTASGAAVRSLKGHTREIKDIASSADGKLIGSAGLDNTLRIWDVASGQCLRDLRVHEPDSLSFAPGNRTVVALGSISSGRYALVFDLASGKLLRVLRLGAYVEGLALAPDGKIAVSKEDRAGLLVWDLFSGERLRALQEPRGALIGFIPANIVLTPDGRMAVSASKKESIRIWEIGTGECFRVLQGHTSIVTAVAVTPDGKTLLSAGYDYDATVRVWDIASGECLAVYHAGDAVISLSGVLPSGQFACGTYNGEIQFVRLRGIQQEAPVVTAVHLFRFDDWTSRLSNSKEEPKPLFDDGETILGHYDDHPICGCLWCGHHFIPPSIVTDAIAGITRDADLSPIQSPCLELPTGAWNERRLLSTCPQCHQPIRFNPFIVNNRSKETSRETGKRIHEEIGTYGREIQNQLKTFCRNCGAKVPIAATLSCEACGTIIEEDEESTCVTCLNCGQLIPGDWRYCRYCGSRQAA